MNDITENCEEITDLNQITKRGRIRAVGNKIITPEFASKLGTAHGTYLNSKGILVISREYNNINRMIKRAYIGGVMSSGVDILNLHSAPVPVLQFCIRRFGASGGVYMSSGSSLEGEITIRLFDSSGVEFEPKTIDSVNSFFKNNQLHRATPLEVGAISDIPHTQDIYKKALPQFINRKAIAQKNLHVVVDCSYGPSSITIPSIMSEMKIDVIAVNSYESDRKATEVFPNLDSIKTCVNIVKAANADLGVILDADGSRALFIDETGNMLTYEEIMMFFIKYDDYINKMRNSPIIISESASDILEQFIKTNDHPVIKSDNFPGEISRSLREERGCFAGADTLKFYFPQYGPFSDATFTTLKILEILATHDAPLTSLIRAFPRAIYSYKTLPMSYENLSQLNVKLKMFLRNIDSEELDYQDVLFGIKLVYRDLGWVLIAPSLHTNVVELTAEAYNPKESPILIEKAEQILKDLK